MDTHLRTVATLVMSLFSITILLDSTVFAASDNRPDKECRPACETPDPEPVLNLSWAAPTTRLDGEPLTLSELDGYKIYYGTESDNLTPLVDLNDSSVTSYALIDMDPGTYYFTVTAYDTSGLESGYSDIVSKQVL